MFEELMEAAAADTDATLSDSIDDSGDDITSDTLSSDIQDQTSDSTNSDSLDDNGNDVTSPSDNIQEPTDADLDPNGDRDDLMDYLDSDFSSMEGLGVESIEWKSELDTQSNVENVTGYLESVKNQEYRALFDINSNQITANDAKGLISQDQFKAVIYNPELNFSKEELHQLAGKIIENKQENAKKLGHEVNAIYAVHQRADGTNGHLHIVFYSEKKAALEAAKVDYRTLSKEDMKNWILERSNLVNSVKAISEAEKARNIERLSSLEGLKRETGTEKRDAIIERYQGKSEHNEGNFSLTQVEKSFEHSVSRGKMSESWKNKFLGEIEGRLKSLEKAELAQKVGDNKWKIDREKWLEFQKDLKETKIEKVSEKVQKTIQEHEQKNINLIDHTVRVVPEIQNIDEIIEKQFAKNAEKIEESKLKNSSFNDKKEVEVNTNSKSENYLSPVTPDIQNIDEVFERHFSQNEKTSNKEDIKESIREEKNTDNTHKPINNLKAERSIINLDASPSLNNIYFENNSVYPQQMVNSNIPGSYGRDPLEEIEFERKKHLKKLEIEN
ncbi:hypothetical protein [Halarcobacter anaerophilus]|uniref:hypothetical protein n=1 Tax=Halarcobacter anaerophilus TaxID=877500 RepID=UPI0005CA27BD|nr:hypothetical protein [Halarcobacter anaerophilus]